VAALAVVAATRQSVTTVAVGLAAIIRHIVITSAASAISCPTVTMLAVAAVTANTVTKIELAAMTYHNVS